MAVRVLMGESWHELWFQQRDRFFDAHCREFTGITPVAAATAIACVRFMQCNLWRALSRCAFTRAKPSNMSEPDLRCDCLQRITQFLPLIAEDHVGKSYGGPINVCAFPHSPFRHPVPLSNSLSRSPKPLRAAKRLTVEFPSIRRKNPVSRSPCA